MEKKSLLQKNDSGYITAGILFLIMVQLSLAVLTFDDIATAKGVGLYFSLTTGKADKVFFDRLVDVCGGVSILLALSLPLILLKKRSVRAAFRLTVLYFAFMPTLDLGMLAHLADGHFLLTVSFDWDRGSGFLAAFLREILPGLFILLYFYRQKGLRQRTWHKIAAASAAVLTLAVFFLPELAELTGHLCCYLIVLVAFDWWEGAKEYKPINRQNLPEIITEAILLLLLYAHGALKMAELMMRHVV